MKRKNPVKGVRIGLVVLLVALVAPSWGRDLSPINQVLLHGNVKQVIFYSQKTRQVSNTNSQPTKSLEFDKQGRLVSSSVGRKPMRTTYEYRDGRLVSYRQVFSDGKLKETATVDYKDDGRTDTHRSAMRGKEYRVEVLTRDAGGRLLSSNTVTELEDTITRKQQGFVYDVAGRLLRSTLKASRDYRGKNPDFRRMMPYNRKHETSYKYNDKGNLVESITHDPDSGVQTGRSVYETDNQGNWIKKTVYTRSRDGQEMLRKIVTRQIIYY